MLKKPSINLHTCLKKPHIRYNNSTTHIKSKRVISFPSTISNTFTTKYIQTDLGFDINFHIFLHECNRITLTHSLNLINDRWGCNYTEVFLLHSHNINTLTLFIILRNNVTSLWFYLFHFISRYFFISIYETYPKHLLYYEKNVIHIMEGY